jgi:hypothetical protein
MKKTFLIALSLILLNIAFSQTRSQVVIKWAAGVKELSKVTMEGDTIPMYIFSFQNAKYQQIVDIESVLIGDINELKEFTNFVDSLITKVEVAKDEMINYSFGGVKNIVLSEFMGKNLVTLYDNDMMGYCYIGVADIKKLKSYIQTVK